MSPPVSDAKIEAESRLTFIADGVTTARVFAILKALIGALLAAMKPRASLVAENLALRQQLAVLRRATPRPRLRPIDRAFWAFLSQTWSRWAGVLAIVKPATMIGWHRRGFAKLAVENPLWSRRRIAGELAELGHEVGKDTVAQYMPKRNGRPGRPQSTTCSTSGRDDGHWCPSVCQRKLAKRSGCSSVDALHRSSFRAAQSPHEAMRRWRDGAIRAASRSLTVGFPF